MCVAQGRGELLLLVQRGARVSRWVLGFMFYGVRAQNLVMIKKNRPRGMAGTWNVPGD